MIFRRIFAGFLAVLVFVPSIASAQITLTAEGKQQLSALTLQLLGIVSGLSQAQAAGADYLASPVFQAQAKAWNDQVAEITKELTTLLITGNTTHTTILPTLGGATSCPTFTRDLEFGMQGGDVAALQLFLSHDSYGKFLAGVNGYFNQETVEAVQRFQSGYGIISGGSSGSTGYGRVGPSTRASITTLCNRGSYVISVPKITIPSTGNNGIVSPPPPPSTPVIGFSTGQISVVPNSMGNSGGPTSIQFSANLLPNSACSAAAYTIDYGDGQKETFTSNASCGNQIKTFTHVYQQAGKYTVNLSSGSFTTSVLATIVTANNSLGLAAASDPNVSRGVVVTFTYNPGDTCVPGTYQIDFGDGATQTVKFNANGCTTQILTTSHTYSSTSQFLITVTDSEGHAVTAKFTPTATQ